MQEVPFFNKGEHLKKREVTYCAYVTNLENSLKLIRNNKKISLTVAAQTINGDTIQS
jgi:hypothetical protein